jgi:hypothetical protein
MNQEQLDRLDALIESLERSEQRREGPSRFLSLACFVLAVAFVIMVIAGLSS